MRRPSPPGGRGLAPSLALLLLALSLPALPPVLARLAGPRLSFKNRLLSDSNPYEPAKADADILGGLMVKAAASSNPKPQPQLQQDTSASSAVVLFKPIKLVLVFYGTTAKSWTSASKAQVRKFVNAIPGTNQDKLPATVHDWFNLARLYADADGHHVSGYITIAFETTVTDQYSTLSPDLINSITVDLMQKGRVPRIKRAVYAFLTSPEVTVAGSPTPCGFHRAGSFISVWAGLTPDDSPCGPAVPDGNSYPQGSKGATALISELARHLVNAVTNPFDKTPGGATGSCPGSVWANVSFTSSNVAFSHTGLDGARYILPSIRNPVTGACAGELAVDLGVCGDDAFGLPCDVFSGPQRPEQHAATSDMSQQTVIEVNDSRPILEAAGDPLSMQPGVISVSEDTPPGTADALSALGQTSPKSALRQEVDALRQSVEGIGSIQLPVNPGSSAAVGRAVHGQKGVALVGVPLKVKEDTAGSKKGFVVTEPSPEDEQEPAAVGQKVVGLDVVPLEAEADASSETKEPEPKKQLFTMYQVKGPNFDFVDGHRGR